MKRKTPANATRQRAMSDAGEYVGGGGGHPSWLLNTIESARSVPFNEPFFYVLKVFSDDQRSSRRTGRHAFCIN